MIKLRAISLLLFVAVRLAVAQDAQEGLELQIDSLNPQFDLSLDPQTGLVTARNDVIVKYGSTVLTTDKAVVNHETGEVFAEGHVRIQRDDQTWIGERIQYNFKTRQMSAAEFRTGRSPLFAAGQRLTGNQSNQTYIASDAFITTDDIATPAQSVHAKSIRIVPGKYFEARHAFLHVGNVPVFYFPYYRRPLGRKVNQFLITPGYRSRFGPFALGTYTWFLNDQLDGELHADYRQQRGFGFGPDVNFHLGNVGEGTARYYYLHDKQPGLDSAGLPIDQDRQRAAFSYHTTLRSNLTVKAVANYQSDERIDRDFFESEYRQNVQPKSFLEVNQLWPNFSLDVLAQPRLNDFQETVERLPDVKLTAFRQQLGDSPLYYESESSVGYFHRKFADTNVLMADFAAARADSFHQILLPCTFFGWLNFTPRVGGRFTYYGESHDTGGTNTEMYRGVFNTGAEISFKASRLWRGVRNTFWDVNGVRHIIEPSVNYVFVPTPNRRPPELPQFDYESPSLRLLPIEFPDYNAIDSIDSQNVLRFGLRNKLQTKRADGLDNLVNWAVYTDWRLNPRAGQGTFADAYSDLDLKPRSWITINSQTRYDLNREVLRIADHTLTLQPNNVWSWTLGHRYLRDGPELGFGNSLLTSSLYYRMNENWGARMTHYYELRDNIMEEQMYTLYRDLRSWTAALTFRLRKSTTGPEDFTVALTFSLKAFPRYGLGDDKVKPSLLLGG